MKVAVAAAVLGSTGAVPAVGATVAGPVGGLHPGKWSFFAPPPAFSSPGGPTVESRPDCKASQIEAVAFTEPSPDGVLGVVEMKGTKYYHVPHRGWLRCALPVSKGPRRLLAAGGAALAVPRGQSDTTNAGGDPFSFVDLVSGRAAWGFGWFGSYCGAGPRYLVMRLDGRRGVLHVPYDGPTPPCPANPSGPVASVLTDGAAGGPAEAVQPAPPSFLQLRTSAHFVGTTTTRGPAPVDVTISDVSDQPVALLPCPYYEVVSTDFVHGRVSSRSVNVDGSTPGCARTAVTVQPGTPVTFRVSPDEISPFSPFDAKKGSTFKVQVKLEGMPTAKASTTVR